MRRIQFPTQFAAGILVGFLVAVGAAFLWLGGSVAIRDHGEVFFTNYPKWIKTVTFENDLVTISVTDFTYHRDVAFEPNFHATCKNNKYGSIVGMPYKENFFFQYENINKGLITPPPLNDVDGIHPTTKSKEAQQDAP